MMIQLPYDLNNLGISAHDFRHLSTIHGMGHTLRVSIFAAMIGQQTGLQQEGQKASVAALFHDLARHHDGKDRFHGKRAAELVESKYKDYILSLGLSEDDIREMQYAIEWHSYDEELSPSHPYSTTTYLLKDADAMDRIRIKALDPKFFRMADGRTLVEMAKSFYHKMIQQICVMHPDVKFIHPACEDIIQWINTKDNYSVLVERLKKYPATTIRCIENELESPILYNNI